MEEELLAWGANSYGQLGLGFKSEQILVPTRANLHIDESIKSIAAGAGHTIILTTNGTLYSCGWNSKGQLGLDTTTDTLIFTKIESLHLNKIVQIACGWDFTIAISDVSELFVWGSNSFHQLSLPKHTKFLTKPTSIQIDWTPIYVACGLRHTVVVTTTGNVFVCGNGTKAQLGLGNIKTNSLFIKVPHINNAISVSCGQYHTVALTSNGDIYVWGNNKYGQLGFDPDNFPEILLPTKLSNIEMPLSIHTGWTHTVILTKNCNLYNCGRNSYGQLGSNRLQFWAVDKLDCDKITKVSVGAEHNLAITDNNKLLCWGWNEHGSCGIGDTKDVFVPQQIYIENKIIRYIATGTGQSFAVIYK